MNLRNASATIIYNITNSPLSQLGVITKFGFGRTSSWIVSWGTKNQACLGMRKIMSTIFWFKFYFCSNPGWNTETYVQKMHWRQICFDVFSFMSWSHRYYYLLSRVRFGRGLLSVSISTVLSLAMRHWRGWADTDSASRAFIKSPTRKTFKQTHQRQKWINSG